MTDDETLVEAEIPGLRRYASALVRDRGDADDLVQDCLEHALRAWSRRRRDQPVRPWLFTIMHNLFISELRRQARRGRAVAWSDLDPEPSEQAHQDHVLSYRDVLGALEQLNIEQKAVLLLVGVENFSYAEAAGILQCSVGTVMSRLSRGRARLRELLDGDRRPSLRRVK